MAYIGVQPRLGNFQACDAISTSATDTFNLLVGGVAIFPQTAQHCLVSLNGILQAPISSYTISGSTIVFASALTSSDSIDFITILGDTLDLGHPSDDTVKTASLQANAVTGAKLNTDVISAQTALTDEPADTDEFLVSDAGTLKRIDYSLIKGGGSMVKLQSQTASSASAVTFTSTYLTTTYKVYQLHCTAIDLSSDGGNLGIQTSTDNGSSYETGSNYKNIRQHSRDDTSSDAIKSGHGTGDDRVRIVGTGYGVGTNNNEGGMSIITIFDPLGTGKGKFFKCYGCHFDENNKLVQQDHTFALDQSAAVNNFKIIPASGTFSGTFTLYGVA